MRPGRRRSLQEAGVQEGVGAAGGGGGGGGGKRCRELGRPILEAGQRESGTDPPPATPPCPHQSSHLTPMGQHPALIPGVHGVSAGLRRRGEGRGGESLIPRLLPVSLLGTSMGEKVPGGWAQGAICSGHKAYVLRTLKESTGKDTAELSKQPRHCPASTSCQGSPVPRAGSPICLAAIAPRSLEAEWGVETRPSSSFLLPVGSALTPGGPSPPQAGPTAFGVDHSYKLYSVIK